MIINLDSIKNIELGYANAHADTIYFYNLVGIKIEGKKRCRHMGSDAYNIKTFEIVLKDEEYFSIQNNLIELTINYLDGTIEHFFVQWGKKDSQWGTSSLQKIHKQQTYIILTSNCESSFLN